MPHKPISDAKRQAIRLHYATTNPKPRQREIVAWFKDKYDRKLGQATISNSLKDCYKYLDTPANASSVAFCTQEGRWPLLEKILFSWQQQFKA